jgi:hypothetical protein
MPAPGGDEMHDFANLEMDQNRCSKEGECGLGREEKCHLPAGSQEEVNESSHVAGAGGGGV